MPAMSGLELVQRLKPLRPDTPFILTSGYIDDDLQRSASEAGVRYLAQKPVATDELLRAIASVRAGQA
ncbi:response regulator FixJ [compost metagenome]